jgi:two-component system, NtrC family, sensor kinase
MKAELYQVPTLALLTVLVAVFAALWLEGLTQPPRVERTGEAPTARNRQLLWLAGWICAAVRLAAQVSGWNGPGLGGVVSQIAMELAPLMFLGSLAPQYLTRKPRILYVVAFALPVMVYCAVIGFDPHPGLAGRTLVLLCTLFTLWVAIRWSLYKHLIPVWLSLVIVTVVGVIALWLTLRQDYPQVGALVHSGVLLVTALLFLSAFRRLSAGLVFTVGGLALWAVPGLVESFLPSHALPLPYQRGLNIVKVITAVGMIVLVLEEELSSNFASQQRDRRARLEMEKYTALYLADMPFDEESSQYNRVCETITNSSRFSQAAIFVPTADGAFRIAGQAGMSGALAGALDALARRTTEARIQEVSRGRFFTPIVGTMTLMDLSPLMEPGDELSHMNFRRAYIMGIRARDGRLQAVLAFAGLRQPEEPLLIEDALPLELLVARIASARENLALLRRLMQAERLAGLGQLAGGVAHELNNPLQSVTGFAELIADGEGKSAGHARVILAEARRMKQIIESLMRFRNAASGTRTPVALDVLLRDIERLMRHDLDSARIVLDLRIPAHLPRIKADSEQMRQVFLQLMRNAMASIEEAPPDAARRLSVEVATIPKAVEVMFSDTGPGFSEPARAFDPYFGTRHPGEGPGLGLSICYAIVREHGGAISAVNLHPRGAAVVVELPVWVDEPASSSAQPAPARSATPFSGDVQGSGI